MNPSLRFRYVVNLAVFLLLPWFVLAQPVWRFSVVVAVEKQTADFYQTMLSKPIQQIVREQMATVNANFNKTSHFNGVYNFEVDSIYVFTGYAGTEVYRPHPKFTYGVVIDGNFSQNSLGGGWWGDQQVIYHKWTWSTDFNSGPFGPGATDGLTHEFGHARGAIDIYGLRVEGSKNPVNGQTFEPVNSIMNFPYGNIVWDEYTTHLLNSTTDQPIVGDQWIVGPFPNTLAIKTVDAAGTPVGNVALELYPVEWFSYAVTGTPVLQVSTPGNGIYQFSSNPFRPSTLTSPWHIRYPNFLIKATYNSVVVYKWMPLYDVQNVYFRNGANSVFTTEIELPVRLSNPAYEGYLDKVECGTIRGWVWDRNKPDAPVTVEFLQGATLASATSLGTTTANLYRPDLLAAGKGNGAHGYSFVTPNSLKDNQAHTIWGRVQNAGYVLLWSPQTLTCEATAGNAAPVAPAVSTLSATVNQEFTTTLPPFSDADHDPLTYSLTGLPGGLNFNAATRTITGIPVISGTFSLTYSAKDDQHAAVSTSLTLSVQPATGEPPLVTGDFEGFLDKVECGTIRGWVWDRNKPNTPITVEFLQGASLTSAVSLGTASAAIYRPDLLAAGKGNGAHGYSFETPKSLKDNQVHTIWGRVQNSSYTLKWAPQNLQCPAIPGNSAPVAPVVTALSVTVNTVFSTILPTFSDADNDPLTYSLTGLPSGLSFHAATHSISGMPTQPGSFVLVYAATDDQARTEVSIPFTVTGGEVVTGDFEGYLDKVNCNLIEGWVWDRNLPNTPLTVEFFANSVSVGTVLSDIHRADLVAAGKGNGVHGYSFVTPASLKNGTPYQITAKVRNSNYELMWSPKVLNCPSTYRMGNAENVEPTHSLAVWPNPSNGEFEVRYWLQSGQAAELVIVDALGRERFRQAVKPVMETGMQRQPVSMPQASGFLVIQLRKTGGWVTQKIVIEK